MDVVRTSVTDFDAAVADVLAETIAARPDAVLLLATGSTPIGGFRELVRRVGAGDVDARRIRVVQLDEYVGIPDDDRRSLYGWLEREVLAPLEVDEDRLLRFRVESADDAEAACATLDDGIGRLGGLDLALLGLGPNGHVGFNEPPCGPDAPTRVVALDPASVTSNARYWGGEEHVPRLSVTVGLGPILAARHVALVVQGDHKRGILRQTLEGPETPQVPASYLRRATRYTVVADEDALDGA